MQQPSETKLAHPPTIDLGEILLRPVRYDDYEDIFDYASDDEVTKTLAWDSYQSIDDAIQAVQNVFLVRPSKGIPAAYAIYHKADQKMIGTVDFFQVDWAKATGEIGYVLHRRYWNRGYMTRACQALIDYGFQQLRLKVIDIRHLAENIGSKRVIEKCGFRYVGDVYHKRLDKDLPSYRMTRREWRKNKKVSK